MYCTVFSQMSAETTASGFPLVGIDDVDDYIWVNFPEFSTFFFLFVVVLVSVWMLRKFNFCGQ